MKTRTRAGAAALAAAMVLGLAGCGGASEKNATVSGAVSSASTAAVQTGSDIVNIGFSDALTSVNPLNMPVSYVDLYANSMQFLPLASFNESFAAEGRLAESITTEDNLTFHVKLRDDAVWSDGKPVTADDVIWTVLKISSPEVANSSFNFSSFKGFENGLSPSGATEVEGLVKIDDKNLDFVANAPMSIDSFNTSIATWICVLPSHVLKDIPAEELAGNAWFDHPDVISGPYRMDKYDLLHYVSYTANDKFFGGEPKVRKLNIRIVDPSQLLPSLESGELDMVHPSTAVPTQDQEKVEALDTVTTTYADNFTSEMTFFNTSTIADARVRQAIVYAIDRESLVKNVLRGHGEVADTFISSVSPYFNEKKTTKGFDPDKAKELLAAAGWDSSRVLTWNVNSADESAKLAVQVAQQQLADVGVKVDIKTVDLATLQAQVGTEEADITSVQYTITPVDYSVDAAWLVDDVAKAGNWTGGFYNEDLHKALVDTQTSMSHEESQAAYDRIEEIMGQEVPLFSLYFQSNPGVVSKRLKNVNMNFFSVFNNIQDWEISE